MHITSICIKHINCIILYFLKLFCVLVRNGNIKRPGFYVTIFSNFAQPKQLNKIKNMCQCCDLLAL